ncbi:MAG: hypothetical protein JST76_05855 [Bacteroidetes bacterium]|nr:hypothetical protein [Bacteroidota bacterium]MBS1618020.1 hypothetical protein [Bacteroidota bacterium]
MKNKLFILIVSAIAVTSFSSCKKDWTCTCDTSGQTTNHEIDNETLLNARSKCKSYEGSVLGVTTTCHLN